MAPIEDAAASAAVAAARCRPATGVTGHCYEYPMRYADAKNFFSLSFTAQLP